MKKAKLLFIALLIISLTFTLTACGFFDWLSKELVWVQSTSSDWQGGSLKNLMIDPTSGRLMLARKFRTQWTKMEKGVESRQTVGIAIDSSDDITIFGHSGTETGPNYYLEKHTPSGALLWSKEWSIGQNDRAAAIVTDHQDNLIIIGTTHGSAMAPGTHFYLAKFSTGGSLIWEKAVQRGDTSRAFGVAIDSQGDILITGMCSSNRNYNYCTIKYDSQGDLIWERVYDGGDSDWPYGGVAVDTHDNVMVAGYTKSGQDIDYLTVKYDSSGSQLWTASYDGGSSDEPRAITTDSKDNIIVTGMSYIDGTPAYCTIKYDGQGNWQWVRTYNTEGSDWSTGVFTDTSSNVIIAGYTDFNQNMYPYFLKFDPQGEFIWANSYKLNEKVRVFDVRLDSEGNIISAGYTGVVGEKHQPFLVKFSDSGQYQPSGYYITSHHFPRLVTFKKLETCAQLNDQFLTLTLQVSDNNFRTIKETLSIQVDSGTKTYDLNDLAPAPELRLRASFSTPNMKLTPILEGLKISAK